MWCGDDWTRKRKFRSIFNIGSDRGGMVTCIHNCIITNKPFLLLYLLVIPPLSFLGIYFFFVPSESIRQGVIHFTITAPRGRRRYKIKKRKGFSDVVWLTRFMFNALLCLSRFTFAFTFYFIFHLYTYPFLPPRGDIKRRGVVRVRVRVRVVLC